MSYKYFDQDYDDFLAHAEIKQEDMKYGLPEKKAYPMPDRKHVMSAIKFFNYVSPKDEEALAKAILARMEEYGISEVNVGPDNRFGKYYEKTSLMHYQIKGAVHGVRRFQNLDGSWTPAGRERYGKGGKPRGDYKDEGKTVAKNLMKTSSVGKASHLSGADFDGDTKFIVKIEDVYSDFKQAIKDARHSNHETVKYLSDKDSIKKLAEGTQASYEKYQTAAKIYQQLNSSEKASQLDLDAFRSAKTKYKEELKEVADKLLGRLKDNKVTTIGEYDGKPVPVSTTYSKLIADALWEANVERNKNIKRLSGADFDGDDVKKLIKVNPEPDIRKAQKERNQEMKLARKQDSYNIDFLETVQNDIVLRKGGKDLQKEYSKYLKNPTKYMHEFRESDYQRTYKNTPQVREAMRVAKSDGWNALTDEQKELLNGLD